MENKIIPLTLSIDMPEQQITARSKKYVFFGPGDVRSRRISFTILEITRIPVVHPKSPIVITRRISTPAPKQEISSPDTRFIRPRFSALIRERTDPMDPQSTTHHTVEPKKTPATNSAADRKEVPWITTPYPGKITKKKTRVSGFAIARATMDR
jgi:hypothetical protein